MGVFLLVENDFGIVTDIVQFDVAPAETHDSVAVPTDYPVEDGANVSDHIHVLPKGLSVEVFVTNTPVRPNFLNLRGTYTTHKLDIPTPFNPSDRFRGANIASVGAGTLTALAGIEGRLVPPIKLATVLTFDPFDAVSETHLKLMALIDGKAKLRIVTSLTEYTNMHLVNVSTPRNASDGTGARFQLTFREIKKVSAASVAAPEIPLLPSGAPTKNRGGLGAKTVDDSAARKASKSIALKLLEGSLL